MCRQRVKIFLVCLIASFVANVAAEDEVGTARIFGGQESSIENAPYIVQLRDNRAGHYCGGTVVAKRFVVTAAHCVKFMDLSYVTVVGNATTITEEGVQRKIAKAFIPEDYTGQTVHNDIAVLKLDADMEGTNIEIMELCTHKMEEHQLIQVSGWGLLNSNATASSPELRTIRIPIASTEDCAKRYATAGHTFTDSMFCASLPGHKDSCRKDSGGPAIYDNQLCGVVSWGLICGDPNFPGVYTDVRKLRNFIEAAMKE